MNDTQSKAINYYAATGCGVAVTILTVGILAGLSFLASILFEGYSYGTTESALYALGFFSVILFFAVPTLVVSKHGWRTVVASFIIQAALITVVAFVGSAIFGTKNQDQYYGGGIEPSIQLRD